MASGRLELGLLLRFGEHYARIGNPIHWIDYSSLQVDPHDLLGNMVRAAEFQQNLQLSRLPNPVDRSLWAMTPQVSAK